MKKAFAVHCILFFATHFGLQAQGCSDAGFCTAPGISPMGDSAQTFKVGLKFSLESTEPGALLFSPQILLAAPLSKKLNAELKVPLWFVSDESTGNNNGISDPILSFTYLMADRDFGKLHLVVGTRIGIGDATAAGTNDVQLPMDYQNSLGTTDLLLGLNYRKAGYSASIGLQYPIGQYNRNQNVVAKYIQDEAADSLNFRFQRQGDVMLRIEKKWQFGHFYVKAGLLPIYHLGDDVLASENYAVDVVIEGSAGLTLNIPFGFWYQKGQWIFGVDGGFPVITRDERPDGLTRKFVLQPRISYNF